MIRSQPIIIIIIIYWYLSISFSDKFQCLFHIDILIIFEIRHFGQFARQNKLKYFINYAFS
jgi:hypothetical protein